jgi:hypothetical protein
MRRLLRTVLTAVLLGGALGAGGLAALADPPKSGFLPDPPLHAARKQWIFEVTAKGLRVSADRVKTVMLDQPAETPRVMGRFALELWVGRELLDRVRFNVPLMGGEPSVGNRNRLPRPRFDENVTAHISARMADNPRAAYLLLVDRDTGDSQKMEWPPDADGHLVTWTMGLSDAGPGDFPDGGVRAVGLRDGGPADAGNDGGR